jgi:hypothetical protein
MEPLIFPWLPPAETGAKVILCLLHLSRLSRKANVTVHLQVQGEPRNVWCIIIANIILGLIAIVIGSGAS